MTPAEGLLKRLVEWDRGLCELPPHSNEQKGR